MTGFILTLGAASSWGQVPATNDTSDGTGNTGGGTGALGKVTTGADNTAYGASALKGTTTGNSNTAVGVSALESNTLGNFNIGVGRIALFGNTDGSNNTAVGDSALLNNGAGSFNTAVGGDALHNSIGNNNIAVGAAAGVKLRSGAKNIYLGHKGRTSESQTMRLGQTQTRTFIAGIATVPITGSQVLITSKGQLGILASSARYKRDIQDMDARSQGVYQLRPVTFRYKQDPQRQRQYGLIAEEVAQVYPELVTKGADGKVESVQYYEFIPLLLHEVQHQQQKLDTQSQELAELKAQNARLQAALVQRDEEQRAQTAALAARLEQLEHEPHSGAVAARLRNAGG